MVKIVGDSTSGISPETAQQLDITVLPLRVLFGTEALRDGLDISNEAFIDRLVKSKEFPTTSQPPAGDFLEVYQALRGAGHEVLCVLLSNKLSGTLISANTAWVEMNHDRGIAIFDTLNVAAGEAIQVLEAARMAQAGSTLAEIVRRLEAMRDQVHLLFVLDTLEYLARGGRIGNVQAFIGTVLQMKPLLEIKDGVIEGAAKVRTKAKAQARLREIIDEAMRGKSRAQMSVVHTKNEAEANALAGELRRKYNLAECPVYSVSPVVAAHAGPGALGVAYYIEE